MRVHQTPQVPNPRIREFSDTGCPDLALQRRDERFLSCFTCPLPHCRYDYEAMGKAQKSALLADDILAALTKEKLSFMELGRRFGLDRRAVAGIVRRSEGGRP